MPRGWTTQFLPPVLHEPCSPTPILGVHIIATYAQFSILKYRISIWFPVFTVRPLNPVWVWEPCSFTLNYWIKYIYIYIYIHTHTNVHSFYCLQIIATFQKLHFASKVKTLLKFFKLVICIYILVSHIFHLMYY